MIRRGMQSFPRGILDKLADMEVLMMVPNELREKILVHSDVGATAEQVEINRIVELIKRGCLWTGI